MSAKERTAIVVAVENKAVTLAVFTPADSAKALKYTGIVAVTMRINAELATS